MQSRQLNRRTEWYLQQAAHTSTDLHPVKRRFTSSLDRNTADTRTRHDRPSNPAQHTQLNTQSTTRTESTTPTRIGTPAKVKVAVPSPANTAMKEVGVSSSSTQESKKNKPRFTESTLRYRTKKISDIKNNKLESPFVSLF